MSDRFAVRRERVLKALKETEADAVLVTSETNVRYLTGFTGDSTYLLLAPKATRLISDSRYEAQLAEECPGVPAHIRTQRTKMVDSVAEVFKQEKPGRVGFEGEQVSFAFWEQLRDAAKTTELTSLGGLVETLRAVKDAGEIAEIRAAIRLAERAFRVAVAGLTPEMTEIEVSYELERNIRRFGGQGLSFEAIVAAGDRAALPHYRPSRNPIGDAGLLLIDWGARGPGGYISDLTRTFATAKPSTKLEKVHGIVDQARTAAITAVRPGMKATDVDAAARRMIEKAGYGKNFGHGLGHGIGLQVHESIRLSSISTDVLKAGMVFTIEPGIYLEGWGGVRIEDNVLVTKDGCEVLSTLPRALERVGLV
ncbi:MAG: Xaa-Pro peptidase family protein [Planctomycetota bacterium]|nr:aminopeptidase P family protein [Planctomycetaceae bacterium]MDQ3329149.1 Xaa-Pro peptidase family protein [Planctomycetota bacterium]